MNYRGQRYSGKTIPNSFSCRKHSSIINIGTLPIVILVALSVVLALGRDSGAKPTSPPAKPKLEENWFVDTTWAMDLSKRPFTSGSYVYQPVNGNSICPKSFTLKSNGKTLLSRIAKYGTDSSWVWLNFPVVGAKPISLIDKVNRHFDDFITAAAKPGTSPFIDLDNDGRTDLIVGVSTGGAHCCNTFKIYSLGGNKATLTSTIESDDVTVVFTDINDDKKLEALTYDCSFAYWNTSFAGSPLPMVILEPTKSGYKFSTTLMKAKAPSKEQEAKILADWEKADKENAIPGSGAKAKNTFTLDSTVWAEMLDLIYTGNSKVAFSLLDQLWKPGTFANNLGRDGAGKTSKDQFISAFLDQLRSSPYLYGIKAINPDEKQLSSLTFQKRK